MKPLIAILFIMLLASCRNNNQQNHPQTKDTSLFDSTRHAPQPVPAENDSALVADLYQFVRMGKKVDTILDNKDYQTVYYCKIGNFLIPDEKIALLIYHNALELYNYKNGQPVKTDSIAVPDMGNIFEFEVTYDDYNFDGRKDIYIQRTISNGIPLSRGCLLIINKRTKKLERHDECDDLPNMKPDPKHKVVLTDSILDCYTITPKEERQICKVSNKWADNKLIPIKSRCHCK